MANVRPFGEVHAIKTMAFALDLSPPLSGPAFNALNRVAPDIMKNLPRRRDQQSFNLTIDPSSAQGAAPIQSTLPEPGGMIFDVVAPNGEWRKALSLSQQFVSMAFSEYQSYANAKAETFKFFEAVLPTLLEFTQVCGYGLQYVDEFVADVLVENFEATALFKPDSDLLPPRVATARGAWLSQHSFFEPLSGHDVNHLVNVQINVGQPPGAAETRAEIQTTHRVQPRSGMQLSGKSVKDLVSAATGVLDEMHAANKRLLMRLLQPEMTERIQLVKHD